MMFGNRELATDIAPLEVKVAPEADAFYIMTIIL
jgi:hypothetical protein